MHVDKTFIVPNDVDLVSRPRASMPLLPNEKRNHFVRGLLINIYAYLILVVKWGADRSVTIKRLKCYDLLNAIDYRPLRRDTGRVRVPRMMILAPRHHGWNEPAYDSRNEYLCKLLNNICVELLEAGHHAPREPSGTLVRSYGSLYMGLRIDGAAGFFGNSWIATSSYR